MMCVVTTSESILAVKDGFGVPVKMTWDGSAVRDEANRRPFSFSDEAAHTKSIVKATMDTRAKSSPHL